MLMPMAVLVPSSRCSFFPSSLSCRLDFASSRRCETLLVWPLLQHCCKTSWAVLCYTRRLIFFWRIFLLLEYLLRCSMPRGHIGEADLIRGRCLPSPLLHLSQPPGFSSHQGREIGFLRAWLHRSLIQHPHLTDETCPTLLCWLWRYKGGMDSSEVDIYNTDICNEARWVLTIYPQLMWLFLFLFLGKPLKHQPSRPGAGKLLRHCPSHLPPSTSGTSALWADFPQAFSLSA